MIVYVCPHCGMKFYTIELFQKHVKNCRERPDISEKEGWEEG